MTMPRKFKGPLEAAVRAVVFQMVSEHGRSEAAMRLGIGIRTMHGWLRAWRVPKRRRPEVDPDDVAVVAKYLDIQKEIEVERRVLVAFVPDDLSRKIIDATDRVLNRDMEGAQRILLSIPVNVNRS
jgi:transposase-like protein